MKKLPPPSAGTSEIRLIFAFDPMREAIFLVAAGNIAPHRNPTSPFPVVPPHRKPTDKTAFRGTTRYDGYDDPVSLSPALMQVKEADRRSRTNRPDPERNLS